MRARAEGRAVVTWRCEKKGCIHVEEAQYVDDSNGWLLIALFEPAEDGAMARMLPQDRVVRIDFPDLVVEATDDDAIWIRSMGVLDETEVAAGKLEPEMFNGKGDH